MQRTLDRIERLESKALTLGDLKTAIKLNWLYNAVKFDGMPYDSAILALEWIVKFNKYSIEEVEIIYLDGGK